MTGGAAWERYRVPASECSRISAEFLAEERAALGEWFYRSEYECEFGDAQAAAFNSAEIEVCFSDDCEEWIIP